MSWKYLNAATLATKANVLAGPVLRKVTPDSVTVWFALQKKATVTLTVMDAAGVRLFDSVVASGPGTGDTIAVGANLHIVAVTAKRKTGEPQLLDGVTYTSNQKDLPDDVARDRARKRQRADDTPALIEERLKNYHREMDMIRSYYPQANIWTINGDKPVADVSGTIEAILRDEMPKQQ